MDYGKKEEYVLDKDEPPPSLIDNVLHNIIYNYEFPSFSFDENINQVPKDILDYVKEDCFSIELLIKRHNFEYSKIALKKALKHRCKENLKVYFKNKERFIQCIKELINDNFKFDLVFLNANLRFKKNIKDEKLEEIERIINDLIMN